MPEVGRSRGLGRKDLELFALRLYVHGPEGINLPAVRRLARSSFGLDVRLILKGYGFSEAEIAHLMNVHPRGCPCWSCVVSLHRAVRRALKRRTSKQTSPTKI